jgi:hypothetical protein
MFSFRFLLVDFGFETAVLKMSSMIPLTILSLDIGETVGKLWIEFSGALLCLVARLFLDVYDKSSNRGQYYK